MNLLFTEPDKQRNETSGRNCSLLILAILLAFPSTGFIQKHAGLWGVAGYVVAVVAVVFITAALTRRFSPFLHRHFKGLATLIIVGLATSFIILHPFEDKRGPGKSSDRDEGLEIAVTRLSNGETPYYPSNKTAGPLSILPGSILLSAPFVALGNPGYQNVFWLAAFLLTAGFFLRDKASALWVLVVPIGISTAAQYEFISGGDLIANGIFVALLFLFTLNIWGNPSSPQWQRWLACILLGVCLASRVNFLLLAPLFGAAMWRESGFKAAILGSLLVVITSISISLPFYLHDPSEFAPLGSRNKIAFADEILPWASTVMIGITILTSSLAALWLLIQRSRDSKIAFFRCCTLVTVTPMICAVLVSSWVNGYLDFGIMKDRFGMMFVFFALLGWADGLRCNSNMVTEGALEQRIR